MLKMILLVTHTTVVTGFAGCTFFKTFTFQNTPLELGLRHIHSPENWACTRPVVVPGFELLDCKEPVCLNGYSMVEFDFHTLLGGAHGRMLTNRCTQSHLIISPSERVHTPFCALQLDVERAGARGHAITLRGQVFGEVSPWGRVLLVMLLQQTA
jgi:hypothetical protein